MDDTLVDDLTRGASLVVEGVHRNALVEGVDRNFEGVHGNRETTLGETTWPQQQQIHDGEKLQQDASFRRETKEKYFFWREKNIS